MHLPPPVAGSVHFPENASIASLMDLTRIMGSWSGNVSWVGCLQLNGCICWCLFCTTAACNTNCCPCFHVVNFKEHIAENSVTIIQAGVSHQLSSESFCLYVLADVSWFCEFAVWCVQTPISPFGTDDRVVIDGHSTSWPVINYFLRPLALKIDIALEQYLKYCACCC